MHGQRAGVGRYLHNLVTRFTPELLAGRFDEVTFYSHRPVDRGQTTLPEGVKEKVLRPAARMLIWENLRFGPAADDDVLFCPSYSRPLITRAPAVVAIHDATCKLHPELYSNRVHFYNCLYGWSARNAAMVITSTEATKAEISNAWNVAPERIRVIPYAAADFFQLMEDLSPARAVVEKLTGSDGPYFLFVGKTTGRRNVPLALEAFAGFKARTGMDHRVVMVGPKPSFELAELVKHLGLAGSVVHSGYVSDQQLNALYNAAEAVISASAVETISMPLLEGQATGVPVICTDTPTSREVSGGAAIFLDRLDLSALCDAFTRAAGNSELRAELKERGIANSRLYSWKRTADETINVLREAVVAPAPRQSR